jgi:hypothetical protein
MRAGILEAPTRARERKSMSTSGNDARRRGKGESEQVRILDARGRSDLTEGSFGNSVILVNGG